MSMSVMSGTDHCVVDVCLFGESLHRLGFALIGWVKAQRYAKQRHQFVRVELDDILKCRSYHGLV